MSATIGNAAVTAMERISDLIGLVYDCILDPAGWQIAMDAIRTELNFCYAILAMYPLPAGSVLLSVSSGIDAQWLARLPAYGEDIVETWGGDDRIRQFPLEEPIVQSQAVPSSALEKSRFFIEWIRPQSVSDAIAIGLERNPTMVSTLSLGRHDDAGAITELELAALRIIAPHVRRALAISRILEVKKIEASKFAAVLEALTIAVVIVDEQTRIIHANAAGQAMLRQEDPIRMRSGQVLMHSSIATSSLRASVAEAAQEHASLRAQQFGGIPAPRREGAPCIVHVLPLQRGELISGLTDRKAVALFVTDSAAPLSFPTDALASLYQLTPAEVRIMELISDGKSLSQVAHMLGIARSTAKTHLLNVFSKTGTRRQSDLVRLLARFASPAGLEAIG
ncbi:helix-turn-helix transcriptional regulator [Rhizobium sp. YK2]|uniref:helix-turn-helix transcriptional regulator n=1 Tax=Rhizobium sp. YK2 TaxID=1860096 RepID=UPI00084C6116|nr:helix-turn-helix transcriptional regulator [Rhizobium sp. YK2]OED00940.1 helix-turn-helix transcriptional regulator [Rhizobium sp. YK2]